MQPTHEYMIYDGRRVQVMERFTAREECHYCGNAPLEDGGRCPACNDVGYESGRRAYARVGLLEGDDAGKMHEVRAAALEPEDPGTEERITRASKAIRKHGFQLRFVDYCEDAETPGILGLYAGATNQETKRVKVATKHRTREEIADTLEHELHHVEDPDWVCGSRDVFGNESPAARRQRERGGR